MEKPTSSLFVPNPNPGLTLTEAQRGAIAALLPEYPGGEGVCFQYASTVDGRTAFIVGHRGIIVATGTIGKAGRVDSYTFGRATT